MYLRTWVEDGGITHESFPIFVFYDLRHTFATWMLEQGENPKIVQEILGHSQITHTMDTYSHVTPNMQREAFSRLNKRLK